VKTRTNNSVFLAAVALLTLVNLIGCTARPTASPTLQAPTPTSPAPTHAATPASEEIAQSSKPRVEAPSIPGADIGALADGNAVFAFDLYQELRNGEGNLFYSPYSISAALGMTYVGARGETEREMADTLHFTLPQDRLHPAFNGLDQLLASRGKGAQGKDDQGFRLNIVNAIWGQRGYQFLSNFLDTLAANYGAGLRILDFVTDPERARQTINDWVSEQTEGKIKDLIPAGVLGSSTRLVLTNAIYFNAAWLFPFQEQLTADAPFHLLDGSQVTAPMMHVSESFAYIENDDLQVVELPYDGEELSMIILLPRDGQFKTVESALDAGYVEGIIDDMAHGQVNLTMPKFEFDAKLSLVKTLAAMGMPEAFSRQADFSGMTDGRDLYISDVLHKAYVSVDESGTEAAAATAVVMKELAIAPGKPVNVTLDHPFIFLIRDTGTGTILFLGRVVDPQ